MTNTIDLFIPSVRRSELGKFLTTMKGLRREAKTWPIPQKPRVREHDQPIPQLRTPNDLRGGYIERYEDPCKCQECTEKRTFDASGDWDESQHPRGQPSNRGEFAETPVSGKTDTTSKDTFPPEAVATVLSLQKKYPQLSNMQLKWNDLGANDVLAHAGGGDVYLNSHYWNQPELIAKIEKEWDGISVDSSVAGVINHEAGHALGQVIDRKVGQKKTQEIFDEVFGGSGYVDMRDVIPGIQPSPYSQENMWEMRAETFAAVQADKVLWPKDSPYYDLSLNASKLYWQKMQDAYQNYTPPPVPEKIRRKRRTKDASPYIAPVYTEVQPGTLAFEEVWQNALNFKELARLRPQQLLHRDAFDPDKHPRGQPENAGEFGKGVGGNAKIVSAPMLSVPLRGGGNSTKAVVNPSNTDLAKVIQGLFAVNNSDSEQDIQLRFAQSTDGRVALWPAYDMEHPSAVKGLVRSGIDWRASSGDNGAIFAHAGPPSASHPYRVGRFAVSLLFGYGNKGAGLARALGAKATVSQDAFVETEHPRGQPENAGEFAEKAGGLKSSVKAGLVKALPDRSDFPEHIKKLVLPPAWTDVHYSQDPLADLLATGRDKKNKVHSVYSEKILATRALAKFGRVGDLENQFNSIVKKNEANRKAKLPLLRDMADCTKLIMETGIRPGSDKDTGAEHKAYGATTLLGKHVIVDAAGVSLKFVPGKKHGQEITLPITDRSTAQMLKQRAFESGPDGELFPGASDKKLQAYTKQLSGGTNKTKDFRTYVATSTALGAITQMSKPTTPSAYRKSVLEVAKRVAAKLGNTPTVALAAYINPVVFSEWRAGVEGV